MMGKRMCLVFMLLVVIASSWGCDGRPPTPPAPAPAPSSIELVSPNGKHKIVIEARDNGCGIWLGPADMTTGPLVAIYEGFADVNTGVVGVWGPGKFAPEGLDAAIVATDAGGDVQIINRLPDGSRPVHFYQAKPKCR